MTINYESAKFLKSAVSLATCPLDSGVEVAFVGRSNVGKSSAINVLTRQNKLARTSKTPGRTQHINFFSLTEVSRLVDLPGYGYAKAPPQERQQWKNMIESYLSYRKSLQGLVLLMDIRHPLTELDQMLLEWCGQLNLPVHILLTKADKLAKGKAKQAFMGVEKSFNQFPNIKSMQLFSSLKKIGISELIQVLDGWYGQ